MSAKAFLICIWELHRIECGALQKKQDFQEGVALKESLKTNLPLSAFSSESWGIIIPAVGGEVDHASHLRQS